MRPNHFRSRAEYDNTNRRTAQSIAEAKQAIDDAKSGATILFSAAMTARSLYKWLTGC